MLYMSTIYRMEIYNFIYEQHFAASKMCIKKQEKVVKMSACQIFVSDFLKLWSRINHNADFMASHFSQS